MRHRKSGRKLGRNGPHRKAMMRNLVTSLFEHERINTTDTRAKELRRVAEKLITVGKRASKNNVKNAELTDEQLSQKKVHIFRELLKVVKSKEIAKKVLVTFSKRYSERPGGYTRILKLGPRKGDNAPMSIIELVDREETGSAE